MSFRTKPNCSRDPRSQLGGLAGAAHAVPRPASMVASIAFTRQLSWRSLLPAMLAAASLSACMAHTAGAVVITEFPLPAGSEPMFITKGPDGSLWFADKDANAIGRMNTVGQLTGTFTLGLTAKAEPLDIVTGPDGNLWFTEHHAGKIGRISMQGTISEFEVPGNPEIYGIAAGPDGNLWFTEVSKQHVGSISPGTGRVTSYPVAGSMLTDIVAGPDGNLWFTTTTPAKIGRIGTSGTGATAFGPLPSASCIPSMPSGCPDPDSIAVGSDGNLWFSEATGDWIGRITPQGGITEYTAGLTHNAAVKGLALGPEGNMWFVEEGADQVGSITPSGVISEFSAGLSPGASPFGITLGADGNLWITERTGNRIARVIPNVPPVISTGGATSVTASSAVLGGSVRSRGTDTSYYFQYGPTTAYGSNSAAADNGAGDTAQSVSATIGGLQPGTAYHYRMVASNANGQSFGADASFTTAPPPPKSSVQRFRITLLAHQSHRRLRISRINLEGLSRGERVRFLCRHCGGSHRKGSKPAHSSRLSLLTANLIVTSRSILTISVTAQNGSSRTKTYVFHPASLTEPFAPRSEACYVAHLATAVACS